MTDARAKLQQELEKATPDFEAISVLSNELLDQNEDAVRFSVDAQHITRLGLELVGKQETALSELIKNAYDADATEVKITFKNYSEEGGQLVVEDNGLGMDVETIKSGWMRLSTGMKVDQPTSDRFQRRRAGKKGIGRFAVQRLGKNLTLETEMEGKTEGIRVRFDWDGQFKAGKDIGTVWSQLETYPKSAESTGTRLIIDDLRDKWTLATLDRVWKSVLLLQPPYKISKTKKLKAPRADGVIPDPGFSVTINDVSSITHQKEISLKSSFLDHATAVITGDIDAAGNATFKLVSEKLGINETETSNDKFFLTGKVSMEARYFIYLSDAMSGISVKDASELGRTYGGIRLYRDGFRVFPYGESQDDWLKLARDTARRNILVPANNHNFFGHVEIDRNENPLLEETSGREGLIENEAFAELQKFARACLEWATKRVAAIREKKQKASQKGFISKKRLSLGEALDEIVESLEKRTLSITQKGKEGEAKKIIETARNKILGLEKEREEEREESIRYESMLRILASLGISIAIFSHEIKGSFDNVNRDLALLRKSLTSIMPPKVRATVEKTSEAIHISINKVFDLGGYISKLMNRTESRTLKTAPVRGAILDFTDHFKNYMHKYQIKHQVTVTPPSLRTCKIHRSEIDSVLFNFLTNSIKAFEADKTKDRKIHITAIEKNEDVVLRFEDNGPGIPDKNRDKIFDAFFTTTDFREDDVAGTGTGLGLKIVSDIAESYGGAASLVKPSKGYTCSFEFRIPSSTKKGSSS